MYHFFLGYWHCMNFFVLRPPPPHPHNFYNGPPTTTCPLNRLLHRHDENKLKKNHMILT